MVQHKAIFKALKNSYAKGGEIPETLAGLTALSYDDMKNGSISNLIENQLKNYDLRYYPNAFNKPGEIILQSSVSGSYVITFGNGSQSVVSYWRNAQGQNQPSTLSAERNFYTDFLFVCAILILTIIAADECIRFKNKTKRIDM